MLALRQEHIDDIARLNEEANGVLIAKLGQELDFNQWMEKEMEGKLKVFVDPLFSQDSTVIQKKTEFQSLSIAMRSHMADFTAHLDFLQKYAAEFREKEAAVTKKKG